jgi:hypothetical protein
MSTAFKISPQPVPMNFKWTHKYEHLTYPGFIPKEKLLAQVRNMTSTPLVGWSLAHEDSSPDGVLRDGYKHTHFAMIFKQHLNVQGARAMDIFMDGDPEEEEDDWRAHPNILPKVTIAQMEVLFTQYHAGRKYDITTGGLVYKKPILHEYLLPPMFEWHRAMMQEVLCAPNLVDACLAGNVRPRTVNDVARLREDSAADASKRFKHLFPRASFFDLAPAGFTFLHVHGGTGLGKTKWACAQFNNPCLIKPFNSVGCLERLGAKYDPCVHDGLVLDEADLSFMTREQVIAFADQDEECTLDVRYKSIALPAGLKKILVSNPAPATLYPPDPHGAIARRVQLLHITAQTWRSAPQASPPPLTQLPVPVTQFWHPPATFHFAP